MAPHHQSSGVPNINVKNKNKKENEHYMYMYTVHLVYCGMLLLGRRERDTEKVRLKSR